MPHCSTPSVVERQPRDGRPASRAATSPSACTRAAMASTPEPRAPRRPRRRGRAGWRRCAPSSRTAGRRRAPRARRRAPTAPACTSRNGGSSPASRDRPHVEQPGTPRAAQVLPPGGREEVAPERVDVDRELADRLARVEQVGHAGLARHRADGGRGVHQPALGRDPRDRHQPHAVVEHRRGARRPRAGRARRRGPPRRRHRCGAPPGGSAITLLAYSARDVRMRSPGPNDDASA